MRPCASRSARRCSRRSSISSSALPALACVALASGARWAPGSAAARSGMGVVRRLAGRRLRCCHHRARSAPRRRGAARADARGPDGGGAAVDHYGVIGFPQSPVDAVAPARRRAAGRGRAADHSSLRRRRHCHGEDAVHDARARHAGAGSSRCPTSTARRHALSDFAAAPALLVAFICSHCPFVRHLRAEFAALAREYQPRGLAVVAINSNDLAGLPAGRPRRACGPRRPNSAIVFPYLLDATQSVAKDVPRGLHARLLPVRRGAPRLVYRGQFDDSRPGNGRPVTGADLRAALEQSLAGGGAGPRTSRRAWAATSSGGRETNRTTSGG